VFAVFGRPSSDTTKTEVMSEALVEDEVSHVDLEGSRQGQNEGLYLASQKTS
jgi:hypothetical protein